MSQFSEKLKFLIENSSTSIYKIAKNSGLERTTLQRSISGSRIPNINFVETLCDYLRLSPAERNDLIELYWKCKIGEKSYAERTYILDMLKQIATLHLINNIGFKTNRTVNINSDINNSITVFSGEYNVNNMLRDILEDEVFNGDIPYICLTVPFNFSFLFDTLKHLYWGSKGKFSIKHLIILDKTPHTRSIYNANLETLSNILPFAFCVGDGYRPHYSYSDADIAKINSLAMPFFLYTSKRLVTISSDFKTAILYNDINIRNVYSSEFQICFEQSFPFVHKLAECWDMVSTYIEALQNCGQVTHVIEPQPCFAKYYYHKLVDTHLRMDVYNREEVKEGLYNYYDSLHKFNSPMKTFFSTEGLAFMVETGIIADLPPRFALPFTVKERIYLLKSLRADIKTNDFIARVIDTTKLPVSSIASIQIYDNNSIAFIAADSDRCVSCFINEQSICDALRDFFEYLPESNLVYNKDKTLEVIDGFIHKLENMKK